MVSGELPDLNDTDRYITYPAVFVPINSVRMIPCASGSVDDAKQTTGQHHLSGPVLTENNGGNED